MRYQRNSQIGALEQVGGLVLANTYEPSIGQRDRTDVAEGEANSIITSYNHHFTGRNDASSATHSFVASPDIVTSMALCWIAHLQPNDRLSQWR